MKNKASKSGLSLFLVILLMLSAIGMNPIILGAAEEPVDPSPLETRVVGEIDSEDADWYYWYEEVEMVALTFILTGNEGSLTGDLDLAVYTFEWIEAEQDYGYIQIGSSETRGNDDEKVTILRIETEHEYWIRVSPYDGATSEYNLSVIQSPIEHEWEDMSHGVKNLAGNIESEEDQWLHYEWHYGLGAALHRFRAHQLEAEIEMRLYEYDLQYYVATLLDASNQGSVAEEVVDLTILESSRIMIQLINHDTVASAYNLSIYPYWIDEEPNDDFTEAEVLSRESQSGWGEIHAEDADWFEVDLLADDILNLTISSLTGDLSLSVYDSTPDLLITSLELGTENKNVKLLIEVASTYYIVVEAADEDISYYYLEIVLLTIPQYQWGIDSIDRLEYFVIDVEAEVEVLMAYEIRGIYSNFNYDFAVVDIVTWDDVLEDWVLGMTLEMFFSNFDWVDDIRVGFSDYEGMRAYYLSPSFFDPFNLPTFPFDFNLRTVVPLMEGSINMTWMEESFNIAHQPEELEVDGTTLYAANTAVFPHASYELYHSYLNEGILNYSIYWSNGELSFAQFAPEYYREYDIVAGQDLQYDLGAVGNEIHWDLHGIDFLTTFYNVTHEGNVVDSGSWDHADRIVVEVDGLDEGIHEFTITTVDSLRRIKTNTITVTVTSTELHPPNSPVLATISPNPSTTGNITLAWTPTSGATEYLVYRSNNTLLDIEELTPIATLVETTYLDLNLDNGTYYYAIVARNASGESSPSTWHSVVVERTPPLIDQDQDGPSDEEPALDPDFEISGYPLLGLTLVPAALVVLLVRRQKSSSKRRRYAR